MDSKIIFLILGLFAMFLLISSEVSARALTETSTNAIKKEVVEKSDEVNDAKQFGYDGYGGYGGYGGGYGGYGGYNAGYGGYGGYGAYHGGYHGGGGGYNGGYHCGGYGGHLGGYGGHHGGGAGYNGVTMEVVTVVEVVTLVERFPTMVADYIIMHVLFKCNKFQNK